MSKRSLHSSNLKKSKIHCSDCNITLSDLGETSSDDDNQSGTIFETSRANVNSSSILENNELKGSLIEKKSLINKEENTAFTASSDSSPDNTDAEDYENSESLEICEAAVLDSPENSNSKESVDADILKDSQKSVGNCESSNEKVDELKRIISLMKLKTPIIRLERLPKGLTNEVIFNSTHELRGKCLNEKTEKENVLKDNFIQIEQCEFKTPVISLKRLSNKDIKKFKLSLDTTPRSLRKRNKKPRRITEKMSSSDDDDCDDYVEDMTNSFFNVNDGSNEINITTLNKRINEFNEEISRLAKKTKHLEDIEWELPAINKYKNGFWKTKINGAAKGRLTSDEIEYLNDRLNLFLKEHNLDFSIFKAVASNNPFRVKIPNDLRLKFIQYLGKDLTHRTPYSVLLYISRLGVKKGRFSPSEDTFLIEMYNNYTGPNFHSLCGMMLNRYRFNIYRRIRRLKRSNLIHSRPEMKVCSTSEVRTGVLNSILNRSQKRDLSKLHYKLSSNMWIAVGRENNISPALAKGMYLCDFSPTMCAEHPIYYNKLCSTLIKRLYAEKWSSWDEISWIKLQKELYKLPQTYIYLLLRKLIMTHVPSKMWEDLKRCTKYLYKNVLPVIFENREDNKEFIMKQVLLSKEL